MSELRMSVCQRALRTWSAVLIGSFYLERCPWGDNPSSADK